MEHHHFVITTDRKSLYTHIKNLVAKAQEIANGELQQRRNSLQKLLEFEDKIYEEEFTNKVKSRIDENIKERRDALLKIKEENKKSALAFLESKRIQQYMESCYEIREALRYKDRQNVKACQQEQILENERKFMRRHDLDKYWVSVDKMNLSREADRYKSEVCIKKKLLEQNKQVLDLQIEDLERKREEERKVKAEEAATLNKLLEEIRLEEFDRRHAGLSAKTLNYRKELLDLMAEKKTRERTEECERAKEHYAMVQELQRLEAEDNAAAQARKRAFNKATLEYIDYVKRMRQLEQDQQKLRDDRIDDLCRVDICTKKNIKAEMERKAAFAAACHAELKRQICEQYERRLREESERRDCKIIENRFAKVEITRKEILALRQRNRRELDKQVEELRLIRAQEEAKYSQDLQRAINDPEFCAQLAEHYMSEGIDYLQPHANWRILACNDKEYVPKVPKPYPDCQDVPLEGRMLEKDAVKPALRHGKK